MKELVIPPTPLTKATMAEAFEAVFGVPMLRRVHGPDTAVTSFDAKGSRQFTFQVPVDNVPGPIRRFFCGSRLAVTTRQRLAKKTADAWHVANRIKLHFVGAELFYLKPLFWLERGNDGVVRLGGRVRHSAILPPPLNSIAESFMMLNSEKELRHFGECLVEAGVVAPTPSAAVPADA